MTITTLAPDPRALVVEALGTELATSTCLKVFVDTEQIRWRILHDHGIEVDTRTIGNLLFEEAPPLGFASVRLDAMRRRQWCAANPRYLWCPRHRCRATPVRLRRTGGVELRAKHRTKGVSHSCYLGFISKRTLERFRLLSPTPSSAQTASPTLEMALDLPGGGGE